jgi:hypothetical protein
VGVLSEHRLEVLQTIFARVLIEKEKHKTYPFLTIKNCLICFAYTKQTKQKQKNLFSKKKKMNSTPAVTGEATITKLPETQYALVEVPKDTVAKVFPANGDAGSVAVFTSGNVETQVHGFQGWLSKADVAAVKESRVESMKQGNYKKQKIEPAKQSQREEWLSKLCKKCPGCGIAMRRGTTSATNAKGNAGRAYIMCDAKTTTNCAFWFEDQLRTANKWGSGYNYPNHADREAGDQVWELTKQAL